MSKKISVLVVDDDPSILLATSRVVSQEGYDVFKAATGAECMRLVKKEKPDLVLLDVNLPDADGFDLCKQIKSIADLKSTLVVHISGTKTETHDKIDGLTTGADGYLTHPISNAELRAWVNAYARIIQTEKELKRLMKEKEILIKEVHHRVKNNFMIVSGLLNLQAHKIDDEKTKTIFNESRDRINTMAMIHKQLYNSENLAEVCFSDYIENLVTNLYQSYVENTENVNLKLQLEDVPIELDKAITCGLIISELVTNTFKYAFTKSESGKGEVLVSLKKINKNQLEILVQDNGPGMPEEFDIQKSDSLGLKLVNMLGKNQLGGELKIKSDDNGTTFQLIIPL